MLWKSPNKFSQNKTHNLLVGPVHILPATKRIDRAHYDSKKLEDVVFRFQHARFDLQHNRGFRPFRLTGIVSWPRPLLWRALESRSALEPFGDGNMLLLAHTYC